MQKLRLPSFSSKERSAQEDKSYYQRRESMYRPISSKQELLYQLTRLGAYEAAEEVQALSFSSYLSRQDLRTIYYLIIDKVPSGHFQEVRQLLF